MKEKKKNKNLSEAKKNKNDEFYTQLTDIANELNHYWNASCTKVNQFKDKIVFLNCDDPEESNFWKYFVSLYDVIGIKKVISTHYDPENPSYKLEYWKDKDGEHKVKTPLIGNGDFKNQECIDILKESDIVCTNPPFSLFREYVAQLVEYDKKFLIIGNMNAITYKEIFPLIKDNKIWTGYGFNLSMVYKTPYKNELTANAKYVKSKGYDPEQGFVKVPGICWFSNLDISKRHEDLILYEKYYNKDGTINLDKFPTYDNYDAIDVSKTNEIPKDYFGNIGVPITFLDKYNPEQFEILDSNDFIKNNIINKKTTMLIKDKDSAINGKPCYARILIKRKYKDEEKTILNESPMTDSEFDKIRNKVGRYEILTDRLFEYIQRTKEVIYVFDYDFNKYTSLLQKYKLDIIVENIDVSNSDLPETKSIRFK